LATVRLRLFENAADLGVVEVEDLAQQERGPLHRRQAFQQHQERHRQRLGHLRPAGRAGQRADDRLRQPGADVALAPCFRGPPRARRWSMHSRVTTAWRYALGDSTVLRSTRLQRRYASWTTSSASA